jgi:hypothetical protein
MGKGINVIQRDRKSKIKKMFPVTQNNLLLLNPVS